MDDEIRIIRTPRSSEHPYFIMARLSAQDETLSWDALGVLTYLLSKPDDWEVRPGDLRKRCGRDKVYALINELIDARYMKRIELRDSAQRVTSIYYKVYESPLPEKPEVVGLLPEKPDTAEPDTENTHSTEYRVLEIKESHSIADSGNQGVPAAHQHEKLPRSFTIDQTNSSGDSSDKARKAIGADAPELLNHPAVLLFMAETGLVMLTKKQIKLLTDKIDYFDEYREEQVMRHGIIGLWNKPAGRAFIEQRIPELKAMDRPITPDNILYNLRHFNKVEGKYGFLMWREKNPNIGTVVEFDQGEVEPEIIIQDIDLFA